MTDDAHSRSLSDPANFWATEARQLQWDRFPSDILSPDPSSPAGYTWFRDGVISPSYNLVTRHVLAGRGDAPAICYDSPVTGAKRVISYAELQEEVEVLAEVLRDLGVKRGDRCLLYMPMVPEALVAMLAVGFLGAVHVVVFGGFAGAECAKRLEGCGAVMVLTASCGVEGARKVAYLPMVREAVDLSAHKPRYILVLQRRDLLTAVLDKSRRELNWNALVRSCRLRRGPVIRPPFPRTAEIPGTGKKVLLGEALRATDPHYILHTSGTTGMPKGVVRPMSHLVGLQYVLRELFGFDQNSVMFCASDIGWVVGHAFIVYAPLLLGAATVLYEGKPVGTPDASQFWRVVEEYKVTALFCAPSALRAVVREDPGLRGIRVGELGSLKGLFLAGERSEPTLVERFREVLGGRRVVDNWWSTESGSPITGTLPHQEIRPGSAGKPLPGWDVRVVSDDGELLPPGTMGNVVLAMPLSPTAMAGLWGDGKGERLRRSYWERFSGRWMDTGDIGVMDVEGYVTILARGDDVINVAAHRLGTAVIEGAVAAVRGVREAFVVPMQDAIKGQVPVAFVVLAEEEEEEGDREGNDGWKERIKAAVRKEVGAIAGLKNVVNIPAAAVPRTRSGKVMRRAFRGLLEGEVVVPEGVEKEVWDVAMMRAREMGLVGGVVAVAKL